MEKKELNLNDGLRSSLSVYDNMSTFDNNNNNNNNNQDDTDNDKDSLIFNDDDHIYEQLKIDCVNEYTFKPISSSPIQKNFNEIYNVNLKEPKIIIDNKKDKSLDSLFNRLALECDQTIEQCRLMIEKVSDKTQKLSYFNNNKKNIINKKNSISTTSLTSTSSSSSSSINIIDYTQEYEKQQRKKKRYRKKLPKYYNNNKQQPIIDLDAYGYDTNDDDSVSDSKMTHYRRDRKFYHKKKTNKCLECVRQRSISSTIYSQNNTSKSNNKNFQSNSIFIKFPLPPVQV